MSYRNNASVELLQELGYPDSGVSFQDPVTNISEPLFDVARKNKVAALLVDRYTDHEGEENVPDYAEERLDYMIRISRTLNRIESNVDRDDIALVKTALPFWIDASDIDIIAFDTESLISFGESLEDAGFISKETTPTAYALRDPETDFVIDAQTDFSAKHVIYFNAETLADGIEHRSVYGSSLPCVDLPKDLALIAVHSITEQMFTMKELYAAISILERMDRSDLKILKSTIEKNHAEPAASAFFSLVYCISDEILNTTPPYVDWFNKHYSISGHREMKYIKKSDFTLPHRYSLQTFGSFCGYKLRNPIFRRSMLHQLSDFRDPRSLKYVISKVYDRRTREHYSRDYGE